MLPSIWASSQLLDTAHGATFNLLPRTWRPSQLSQTAHGPTFNLLHRLGVGGARGAEGEERRVTLPFDC